MSTILLAPSFSPSLLLLEDFRLYCLSFWSDAYALASRIQPEKVRKFSYKCIHIVRGVKQDEERLIILLLVVSNRDDGSTRLASNHCIRQNCVTVSSTVVYTFLPVGSIRSTLAVFPSILSPNPPPHLNPALLIRLRAQILE